MSDILYGSLPELLSNHDEWNTSVFYYSSEEEIEKEEWKLEILPIEEREIFKNKIKEGVNKEFEKEILDTCKNCLRENEKVGNCFECDIEVCRECSYLNDEKELLCIYHPVLIYKYRSQTIEEKLASYKRGDKWRVGYDGNICVDDIIELFEKQKGKCYICKDPVWLKGSSGCRYLLSVDRIDNDRAHDKDNCLIACNYCNCRKYNYEIFRIDHKKKCTYGCHTIERDLPKKETVIEELIKENIPERFKW